MAGHMYTCSTAMFHYVVFGPLSAAVLPELITLWVVQHCCNRGVAAT
jgi:hypothetical protein